MNRICELFGIRYPIISGGMVWCSGWRLAAAVSNAGGLGLLGAGSMHPEVLREHIQKCKAATDKPFGVNVPLLYPEMDTIVQIIIEEKVPVVFTSAGNPKTWTAKLKENGIKVAHVVSSSKFARKCEEAGVDAIVAEGFEAGGHNGREETTTMCLIPAVRRATTLPLIAAGGIGTGESIAAAMSLGAEGVQIGTRFALSAESSAHENFKSLCLNLEEADTTGERNIPQRRAGSRTPWSKRRRTESTSRQGPREKRHIRRQSGRRRTRNRTDCVDVPQGRAGGRHHERPRGRLSPGCIPPTTGTVIKISNPIHYPKPTLFPVGFG